MGGLGRVWSGRRPRGASHSRQNFVSSEISSLSVASSSNSQNDESKYSGVSHSYSLISNN